MAHKLNAKQRKAVEAQFKAIKRGDVLVTLSDLMQAEFKAADQAYGSDEHRIAEALYETCAEWSRACRAQYDKMAQDVQRIADEEQAKTENREWFYLFDEGVDAENVTVGGVTEQHVCYWSRMVHAGGMAAGSRANEYGIDLNARLGYIVY